MGLTGAGLVGAAGVAGLRPATVWGAMLAPQDPDLVVFNAKVYTVDDAAPRAQAFAVKNSRFIAVGTTAEMRALAGRNTQLFDAKQMTIVPGFADCHNHAPGNMSSKPTTATWPGTATPALASDCSTPIAIWSLAQMTASGRPGSASSNSPASAPLATLNWPGARPTSSQS